MPSATNASPHNTKPAHRTLVNWFHELHGDMGDLIPAPDRVAAAISASEAAVGSRLNKAIGSGTNGLAFSTSDGTVAKFTIDAKEAQLWAQLGDWSHPNLANHYGCWRLCPVGGGDSAVYLIHNELVPRSVGGKICSAIEAANDAAELASDEAATDEASRPGGLSPQRTMAFQIQAYRRCARGMKVPQLDQIADLLVELMRRGVALFDLQPDNFMVATDGTIKMIDPSVPLGVSGRPERLSFEQKLTAALRVPKLRY